jgi:hypothetical protein
MVLPKPGQKHHSLQYRVEELTAALTRVARLWSGRQTCFGPETLTGAWEISDDLRSIAVCPVPGYLAGLEIDALKLAADSAPRVSALKDLCSILKLKSTVSRLRSESDASTVASGSDSSESSVDASGCAKHAIDAVAAFN